MIFQRIGDKTMNKFWVPFINWKRRGDFETKIMTIVPFFFYIYKRQYIKENNTEYSWGCYITPFLSLSFQFGWHNKNRK